jgi:glyoxylase I family protein
MPAFAGVTFLGLSVVDASRSAAWYSALLGMDTVREYDDPDGHVGEVLLREPRTGFELGLIAHRRNTGGRFDEVRTGLDHVEFGTASRQDLEAWVAHLDALHIEHSGMKETAHGALVTFRDPDNIQLEFYWPRR